MYHPKYKTMTEEIFGPLVTIYIYEDNNWDQTLELIDGTSEYALTGAVISTDKESIDYAALYDPFVKTYSDIQLALQNNTSDNPAYARKYADDIVSSVDIIRLSLDDKFRQVYDRTFKLLFVTSILTYSIASLVNSI